MKSSKNLLMLVASRILCNTEIDSFPDIKRLLHKVWALTECICISQVTYRYGISITITLSRARKHTHTHKHTHTTQRCSIIESALSFPSVFPTSASVEIRNEPDS